MSAHADDLRHVYAESLGPSEIVAAGVASAKTSVLPPGRYAVRVRNVAGAALAWFAQGEQSAITATAAVPSTPFDIGGTILTAADRVALAKPLFTTVVRNGQGIAVILDAGTASVIVTKISRDSA